MWETVGCGDAGVVPWGVSVGRGEDASAVCAGREDAGVSSPILVAT